MKYVGIRKEIAAYRTFLSVHNILKKILCVRARFVQFVAPRRGILWKTTPTRFYFRLCTFRISRHTLKTSGIHA